MPVSSTMFSSIPRHLTTCCLGRFVVAPLATPLPPVPSTPLIHLLLAARGSVQSLQFTMTPPVQFSLIPHYLKSQWPSERSQCLPLPDVGAISTLVTHTICCSQAGWASQPPCLCVLFLFLRTLAGTPHFLEFVPNSPLSDDSLDSPTKMTTASTTVYLYSPAS